MSKQRWKIGRTETRRAALQAQANTRFNALRSRVGQYRAIGLLARTLRLPPFYVNFGTMSEKLLRRAVKVMRDE